MIGGNSGGMSIQGKSPGTNNLQFNGGWTFSSSGATGNGTNAYANTFYNDNQTSTNDFHMGIYSFKPDITNSGVDCGVGSASANSRTAFYLNEVTQVGISVHRSNSGYATWTDVSNNGAGMFVGMRTGSTSSGEVLFWKGVQRSVSSQAASNARCDNQYVFGARRIDNNVTEGYNNRGYNFFCIGKALTSGETSTLSSIINTFNTTLGRNTY